MTVGVVGKYIIIIRDLIGVTQNIIDSGFSKLVHKVTFNSE